MTAPVASAADLLADSGETVMRQAMRPLAACLLAAAALAPPLAFAQGSVPESGESSDDAAASASASASIAKTPATAVTTPPVTTQGTARSADVPANDRDKGEQGDHEAFVRHVAVGFLGASQIPIAQGGVTKLETGTVMAPVLGARYWVGRRVGLDVGVGLGIATTSASTSSGGVTTTNNSPVVAAFALHGGLPIALAYSKHFTFELIPEVHFGYAGTTVPANGVTPPVGLNGVRFDLGGRIGAEIQFGFIGIPQLSLQGSIGLSFRYDTIWASQDTNRASASSIVLGTTLQNDPWAIFTNSVAALYYF